MISNVIEFIKQKQKEINKNIEYKITDDFVLHFKPLTFKQRCDSADLGMKVNAKDITTYDYMMGIIHIIANCIHSEGDYTINTITNFGFTSIEEFIQTVLTVEQINEVMLLLIEDSNSIEQKK